MQLVSLAENDPAEIFPYLIEKLKEPKEKIFAISMLLKFP